MKIFSTILAVLSCAYSFFTWYLGICAIRWGPHENWAGALTMLFGLPGVIVQLLLAIGLMIDYKQKLRSGPPIDVILFNLSWLLTGLALVVMLRFS